MSKMYEAKMVSLAEQIKQEAEESEKANKGKKHKKEDVVEPLKVKGKKYGKKN